MKPVPSLFQGLNDVDLHTARRNFVERVVAPGERLIKAADPADGVICVVDGRLEIVRDGKVIGEAGPNDLVGEIALFHDCFRLLDVFAAEQTHILTLSTLAYEGLCDVLHPVAATLERRTFANLVARLHGVNDQIAELSEGKVRRPLPPGDRFLGAVAALFGRGGKFSADRPDPVQSLRRCPMFADAMEEALVGIARHLVPASYGPGALLCTEGERDDHMFLIDEGTVEVVVAVDDERVQRLATFGPGVVFGMVALVENGVRMCSVIAKEHVVVQTIDCAAFHELVNEPCIAGTLFRRALIRALIDQLAYSNAQLATYEGRTTPDLAPLRRAHAIGRDATVGIHPASFAAFRF